MANIKIDYSEVTELPGTLLFIEQLKMICMRYYVASRYSRGKDVFEVGCGAGLGLGYLHKTARLVLGGDYNPKSLGIARGYYGSKIPLFVLDAHELPFKDGSFDVVLMFEVIFYLGDPEKFLKECRRVLRDRGCFIICLPNKDLLTFIESPHSIYYFSVPELGEILSSHFAEVLIYGCFPISTSLEKKFRQLRVMLGKLMTMLPGGSRFKEYIKRRYMGKNISVGNEVDGDLARDVELVELSKTDINRDYQIIYAVCCGVIR